MALATTQTKKSVSAFIKTLPDSQKKDCKELVKILKDITGKQPRVWGDNYIIGFGKYTYKRKGGKEEFEWFNVGFAPRKSNITLYVTYYLDKEKALLKALGNHKVGKGCLYIKSLSDVHIPTLKKILRKSKDLQWGTC